MEILDKNIFVIGSITKSDIVQVVKLSQVMWLIKEKNLLVPDCKDRGMQVKVVKITQNYVKIVDRFRRRKDFDQYYYTTF